MAEWLKAADCKSARVAYTGSNPVPSTIFPKTYEQHRTLVNVFERCKYPCLLAFIAFFVMLTVSDVHYKSRCKGTSRGTLTDTCLDVYPHCFDLGVHMAITIRELESLGIGSH